MRYLQSKAFPPYAFIPGLFPHPEKEGGHMYGQELEAVTLTEDTFQTNEAYLYGLDLFNYHYYWEAHVFWEALWHKAGRKGQTADFLKALIKISAGGVKYKMGQQELAQTHFLRAIELFTSLENQDDLYGVSIKEINESLAEVLKKPESFETLVIHLKNSA